jgi:hypothetical protein
VVHVWSTRHRTRAGSTVCNGASFAPGREAILQKQARVQNPDKDEVLGAVHIVDPRAADQ